MVFVSHAPHSYTGEDTVEFQCHGSPAVLTAGLSALLSNGFHQAGPGEFTKRAFLNGQMDLTQAEAVIDLIDAETAESARNAAAQLSGALRRPIESVYDKLLDVSSRFYAVVDYPDEDIEDLSREETEHTLLCCEETLSDLLGTFARGKVLKNGVATAIIGAPNAGKSSLLNALVGFDRAIVTDIAGTTRDTVEEKATVGGVLLRLIDTAGLHETDDLVEQLGVERSKKAVEDADLILVLLDGSTGLPASEGRAEEMLAPLALAAKSGKPWLLLLTKSDLGRGTGVAPDEDWRTPEAVISLSSVTHEGFDALEAAIRTLYPAPKGDTSLVTNARQADAIRRALDSVRAAKGRAPKRHDARRCTHGSRAGGKRPRRAHGPHRARGHGRAHLRALLRRKIRVYFNKSVLNEPFRALFYQMPHSFSRFFLIVAKKRGV